MSGQAKNIAASIQSVQTSIQNLESNFDVKLASIQQQQSTRKTTPDSASTPLIGLSSSPEDRQVEEKTISETIEHFCSEENLEILLSGFERGLEIR
jgi:hypothetical protein